jgi:hypothetical protein
MVKYKRFNREKWDADVALWDLVIGGDDKRFVSPRDRSFVDYWDIEVECESYEKVDDDKLLKIEGDYLFSHRYRVGVYYSVSDYYDFCKVRGEDFPDKMDWVIRELRIDMLL